MTKLLLFASLLAFWAGSARAQTPATGETLASQQLKQRLRGQYLTNDTAQAIITLYGRRQAGGVGWIIGSLLAAVRIGTASSNTAPNYGGYPTSSTDGSGNLGGALLIAIPLVGYGVAKILHYSNGHLEQELTAYAAGQPLPHSLRRKLKRRFFTAPIVPYKAIKAQPVIPQPAPAVK